jgi:hypothetical protein
VEKRVHCSKENDLQSRGDQYEFHFCGGQRLRFNVSENYVMKAHRGYAMLTFSTTRTAEFSAIGAGHALPPRECLSTHFC